MRSKTILIVLIFVLVWSITLLSSFVRAQSESPVPPPAAPWPRKFVSGNTTVSLYQPQLEKWQDNQLSAFGAVEVQTADSKTPTYGVIWFNARTEVDKVNRQVTLLNLAVTKSNFPGSPNNGQDYVNIVVTQLPEQSIMSLDTLEADLNLTDAKITTQEVPLQNEPPKIIFSTTSAILILIDGQPALRPVPQTKLQRVINTNTLILFDPSKNLYYLQMMDGWMESHGAEGPWSVSKMAPKDGDKIKNQLVQSKQVVLLEVEGPDGKNKTLKDGPPTVYVSTVPAELIQSQGQPQMVPIANTELLYVKNTADNIFVYEENNNYYVLIAGRWFSAPAMTGPWAYVVGSSLPPDFQKIPQDSPKASVLVSVPGTEPAKEARIENSIPQTATITRSAAQLTVSYDGKPDFKSIKDTNLKYAANTTTPVIDVPGNTFYAVQNGVWFTSAAAVGPWVVATTVPGVIYTIPPSSSLYYVTFVKVYGYTDQYVYVGYTPGYYGTVVSTDGVVVYGTGYYYPPYIGTTVYVAAPATYGVGAGFTWGLAAGWALGFGMGYASSSCYPWWGPVGFYGGYYGHVWAPAYGWGAWGGAAATNVYGHWGNTAYQGTRSAWANPYTGNVGTAARGTAYNPVTGAETAARGGRNTNVYTGNQVGGVGGVHYNPTTGVVSGGRAGYAGNMYTGNYEAGAHGFAYDTKTGQGISGGNVYGDQDGNVFKQGGSGWQQWNHNSGSWGDAGGSHDFSGLNNYAGSRSFGGMRSSNFSGFSGARFGGFRRR